MGVEARSGLCPRPLRRNVLLLFVWLPLFPWQLPLSPALSEEDLHGGVSFRGRGGNDGYFSGEEPSQYLKQHKVSYYLGNAQLRVDWWASQARWGGQLGGGKGKTGSAARPWASLRNSTRTHVRTILPPLVHCQSQG